MGFIQALAAPSDVHPPVRRYLEILSGATELWVGDGLQVGATSAKLESALGVTTITSAASSDILQWNGTAWVNVAFASMGMVLSDLSDVTITSIASGEILKWNGSTWINNTLAEAGVAAASHNHSAADITSGTLAVARGGTNSGVALNNDRIMVSSSDAIVEAGAMTNGQMLIGSTGAAPVVAGITGTANQVDVDYGAGTVSLSLPQSIATTSAVSFGSITCTSFVTAPIFTASTALCVNLNADQLDGNHASAFATVSHTHTESDISDLGTTVAMVADNLSVFAATTSAQLAGVITNETGTGSLVFATSPTLVTPILGTPTSGTLTNCTGPTSMITSGTFADARIAESNVTQHKAATNANVGILSFAAPTELTISGGVVTATQTRHQIDTEGDAATDDLDTINGGSEGQILILKAINDSRTVVVKHGTGNIATADAVDISLDVFRKFIVLLYQGSNWYVIAKPF